MKADYEVTWDKDGYFQSSRRHTQDSRNDGPRRRSYNSRYSPEDVRSKRYKVMLSHPFQSNTVYHRFLSI